MSLSRTMLFAGASGLIGRYCLELALDDPLYSRITVLTRRPLPAELRALDRHGKLDVRLVDWDRLVVEPTAATVLANGEGASGNGAPAAPVVDAPPLVADQVLCTIGTTMRQAGSRERFRTVDHDYVLALARLGLNLGASHFLAVSAIGADARSRVFYNRVKGETEDALRALAYRSLTLVRPSLLLGPRVEFRLGEEIARRFAWAAPERYRPVHGRLVACSLLAAARADRPGLRIIESAEILAAARERERQRAEAQETETVD